MDLDDLLAMKRSPLSTVSVAFSYVDKRIIRVGSSIYLQISNFDKNLEPVADPEIVAVVWAACAEGLNRALNMDIEADNGVAGLPPTAMTFGMPPKYGDLLRFCKSQGNAHESASYRIATDGKFICRTIASPLAIFYFRGQAFSATEVPFVISRKLTV